MTLLVSDLLYVIDQAVKNTAARMVRILEASDTDETRPLAALESQAARIEAEAFSLADFVSSLRALVAEEQADLQREPTLLQRSVPQLVTALLSSLAARELSLDFASDLPAVLANRPVLDLALKTLILIEHRRAPLAETLRIAGRWQDAGVVLSLTSEGRGPTADRARQLEFAGVKASIAYRLLVLMGVSLRLLRPGGGGREIRLVFPVADVELVRPPHTEASRAESTTGADRPL